MSPVRSITIIGGHGKVALRLSTLLSPRFSVHSVVRSQSHFSDVLATGAQPTLLSLEADSAEEFTKVFEEQKADVVVFAAGSGGQGGPERHKAVDFEGAVKVFDAVEGMKQPARLLLVSTIDSRDRTQPAPEHYTEADLQASDAFWSQLETYFHYKYLADKDLWPRTAFKWTIVRPGLYQDTPGTGKGKVGRTGLGPGVPRDDVAKLLALLVERPEAAGLALDFVGGEEALEEALDKAVEGRVSETY